MRKWIFYLLFLPLLLVACTKPPEPLDPRNPKADGSVYKTGNDCNGIKVNGIFIKDSIVNSGNSVDVVVSVTWPGTYSIYTDTVNGIYFRSEGKLDWIGLDTIRLSGYGVPLSNGTYDFTVNFKNTSCNFSINTTTNNVTPGTVDSTTVFFGSYDGYFYAVQGISGKLKWRYKTGAASSTATLLDSFIYFGSHNYNLYALNARTGAFHWQYYTGGWPDGDVISTAVMSSKGHVYFSCDNGKSYCIDTTCQIVNGIRYPKVKWIYNARGHGSPAAPAVGNNLAFFGADTVFYVVDVMSGALKWKYSNSKLSFDGSNATIGNGIVYVATTEYEILAFSILTGNIVWRFDASFYDGAYYSSPTVVGNVLYLITPGLDVGNNTGICALNATTGALLWVNKKPRGLNPTNSSPIVANGMIYCGSEDGYLYAWDASNGSLKWEFLVGGVIYSSPTVVGNLVYIASTEGNMYAVDATTGTMKWKFSTGGYIHSASAFVAGASGKVYHPGSSGGQN